MQSISPLEYLDSLLVDYSIIPHSTTFTSQETAKSVHIKGSNLGKVTVLGNDFSLFMVVIPANHRLMLNRLARMLNRTNLAIIPEAEFAGKFPECEPGAMPPFGRLYGMDVYVAKELVQLNTIVFNGGTHNLLIKINTFDFIDLSNASIISDGYINIESFAHDTKRVYQAPWV
ncbi:aminoacyl-tRNA deacylase [Aliikangiella maris]|uniref:YbaK/EbsC family protein n=2 Tax=Aliikangiella maris TaxID=3162458 RepID=A0ABV3MPF5_9GAMM